MDFIKHYYEGTNKYFSKHVIYCSFVHAIAGIGMGIIIARPLDMGHPVQLGILLIGFAILAHVLPVILKMK